MFSYTAPGVTQIREEHSPDFCRKAVCKPITLRASYVLYQSAWYACPKHRACASMHPQPPHHHVWHSWGHAVPLEMHVHSQCACTRTQHTAAQPLPLTLHPRRYPAPSPGGHCWYLCPLHTMRGVRYVLYGTSWKRRGTNRPAPIKCKHTRQGPRSTVSPGPPPATVTRTPTQTNQTPNHTCGAREGA